MRKSNVLFFDIKRKKMCFYFFKGRQNAVCPSQQESIGKRKTSSVNEIRIWRIVKVMKYVIWKLFKISLLLLNFLHCENIETIFRHQLNHFPNAEYQNIFKQIWILLIKIWFLQDIFQTGFYLHHKTHTYTVHIISNILGKWL